MRLCDGLNLKLTHMTMVFLLQNATAVQEGKVRLKRKFTGGYLK